MAAVIHQMNPAIPVNTPSGPGYWHVMIDYGQESHVVFGVLIDSTLEWRWYENPDVRGRSNETLGRRYCPENAIPGVDITHRSA